MENINNYKLAIIGPDYIDYRGDFNGEDRHEDIMVKYAVEKYGDDFAIDEKDINFKSIESFLAAYQNVLFYNLPLDDDNKFGIISILDYIDENQLKNLQMFLDSLEGFTVELDCSICADGEYILEEPIEESFYDGFVEIRNFLRK